MKALVFQHAACEGPGLLGELMKEEGMPFEVVHLYNGVGVPDPTGCDALIILGGPMNVYEEEKSPFLCEEGKVIKHAIAKGIPYLGICLGAQLLAKTLGGLVTRNPTKEIGFYEVELTQEGARDPIFQELPKKLVAFQWHGDTFTIPDQAKKLAYSSICPNQAFRYGDNAYALQFHLETTPEMIGSWVKEYQDELADKGPWARS